MMTPFLLVLLLSVSFGYDDTYVDLNGDWMLTNTSMTKPIDAKVPGEIYYPLLKANIINDPFYGMEAINQSWVATVNWTFYRSFTIDQNSNFLNYRVIQLVSNGIDTKANVYINNNLIFMNDNMFHRNIINIPTKYLNYGANIISVNFTNKPLWALNEQSSCNTQSDTQCPASSTPEPYDFVNYIRTEPCSFGWNWAAGYSPVGIWKDIYLQSYNDAVIRDFMIYAESTSNISYSSWNVKVVVYIDSGTTNILQKIHKKQYLSNDTIKGMIRIEITNISKIITQNVEVIANTESNFTVDMGTLNNIDIWMPNEYGNQPLYQFKVNFVSNNSTMDKGINYNFGFREVQLIQDPLPGGKSFYFRVNGVNITTHGSNWIPINALDNSNYSVNRDTLEPFFVALKDSHQNMLRNWGGGIYQQNAFYELADEYGIMIWEDMMFACAQYWLQNAFLQSVSKEVIDNVKYLQHHSSIAIWSANNENGVFCKQGNNASESAYRTLYWGSVLNNIILLDPTRPHVSSSPSNGSETEENPCCANVFDWDYGDDHQYLLAGQDCWNVGEYYPVRFASEFGWESWPIYSTMTKYLPESEWYWNSPMMTFRQKNNGAKGQQAMITEILNHFNLPNVTNKNQQFMYTLYATNYAQAYCTKVQIEYYRSLRYTCYDKKSHGHGCNMGQMYWQTNDMWPGSSWSSIDILYRYKMEQYFANKFYAKTIVAGYNNQTHWTFWGINDYLNWNDSNCILQMSSYSYLNGLRNEWNVSLINIETKSAAMIYAINNNDFLSTSKCSNLSDCILMWNLIDSTDTVKSSNWMFIGSPKNTTAINPELKILNVKEMNNMQFMITFNCKSIAVFVWLETEIYGYFNDNGMLLLPGNYSVTFYASEKTNSTALQQSLYIYSLYEAGGFLNG